jgi:hypothetical protein
MSTIEHTLLQYAVNLGTVLKITRLAMAQMYQSFLLAYTQVILKAGYMLALSISGI